jgi:hypothetical protein
MMDDQKILDNAPEGEDFYFVDITGEYFDEFGNHLNSKGLWSDSDTSPVGPRSIADIKELVELRNANAGLEKDNAHLKKEVDKHRAGFVACMTGEQFTIHNLKQEAKGIELLIREETSVGRLHNGDKRSFIFCQDAKIRALELLGKAKSLKAGN